MKIIESRTLRQTVRQLEAGVADGGRTRANSSSRSRRPPPAKAAEKTPRRKKRSARQVVYRDPSYVRSRRNPPLKITIEATDQLTSMDGVPVRVWNGVTEHGARCLVFVHRLAVPPREDSRQLDNELDEQLPPGRKVALNSILN